MSCLRVAYPACISQFVLVGGGKFLHGSLTNFAGPVQAC